MCFLCGSSILPVGTKSTNTVSSDGQIEDLVSSVCLKSQQPSAAKMDMSESAWTDWGSLVFKWLLLVAIPVVYYWIWSRSTFVQLVNAIPGPRPIPFLGNVLDLYVDRDEFLKIVHIDWIRKYGSIYRAWGGTRPVVVISSPELMEPILVSQKLITKATEYSFLSTWLGECMFLTTGTRWKNRRRLLTPAFHFQILNSFVDVFNEKSFDCGREFERAIVQHGGKEFDVFPIITQCALDIICETSMGKQTRGEDEKALYVQNLHRIGQIVMERGIRPWLRLDWIYQFSALGRENKRCVKALHNFTNKVINDRREALQKELSSSESNNNFNNNYTDDSSNDSLTSKKRLAFLDLLIAASENGANLSDDDIREEVDTVMFAGHDTTASAMTWFLYCLAMHPHHQDLVTEEVDQIFGDSDRPCSIQDVAELKYLECCIKETLRLYPSVPAVMRYITEDIHVGGYKIPAGVSVSLMIYGMHHNPLVYPDPQTFNPERFLPENVLGRHPYAFVPFSAGPRNCIGQKYGLLEIKIVLANLLRRFRFSVADPSKPMLIPSSEVVLKPKQGVPLIVSKRAAN
ncbi:cytochrome P450 4c3-like [Daphnia pulex]|uniref:cytochrome P450 4c3-like n=1 Tax=Daphnia pulex TaxID=6669 RepID=UPI001EDE1A64|nr:cytochrome P450 4c3-like [Daphnia pulex]